MITPGTFFRSHRRPHNWGRRAAPEPVEKQTMGGKASARTIPVWPARLFLSATLAACLTHCVTAGGGLAVSNIPIGNHSYDILGTEKTTIAYWALDLGIIGLPLSEPPVAEAESELLSRYPGDDKALINLRYWNDESVFLIVVNRRRFHLQADVVRLVSQGRRK